MFHKMTHSIKVCVNAIVKFSLPQKEESARSLSKNLL